MIEISEGLDTEDLKHLAEELGLDLPTVTATAEANITKLEEAAHYALMDALRALLTSTPERNSL